MKSKLMLITSLLMLSGLVGLAQIKQASADLKMKVFIDGLMKKMTLEEKIGQLNLPGSGDIVTGQSSNSDIGKRIREGNVGGLLNIKSVEKIREIGRAHV